MMKIKKLLQIRTMNLIGFARLVSIITRSIRKLFSFDDIVVKKRRNVQWELDLKEAIDFSMYFTGNYEPALEKFYKKYLKPNSIVLDIGANVGAHTLRMADCINHEGMIHAIEPTEFALKKLKKNMSLNLELKKRIQIHQVFLQQKNGEVEEDSVSSSWSIETPMNTNERNKLDCGFGMPTEGARGLTLDSLVEEINPEKIDLIKLDVDGQEFKIVNGAIHTLRKYTPVIIVECAPMHFYKEDETFQGFIQQLIDLEYKMYDFKMKPIRMTASELEDSLKYGSARDIIFKKD